MQLDAHADLRQEWLGSKYNHACAMSRCLDILPSKKIFQVGIRSGTNEEFKELKKEKRLVLHETGKPARYLKKALNPLLGQPIYISIKKVKKGKWNRRGVGFWIAGFSIR